MPKKELGGHMVQASMILASFPYLTSLILSLDYYNSIFSYCLNMFLLILWYPLAPFLAYFAPEISLFSNKEKFSILGIYILAVFIVSVLICDLKLEVKALHLSASYFVNFGRLVELLFPKKPYKELSLNLQDSSFRVSYVNSVLDLTSWKPLKTSQQKKYMKEVGSKVIKTAPITIFSVLIMTSTLPRAIKAIASCAFLYSNLELTGLVLQLELSIAKVKVTPFNVDIFQSENIADFWGKRWDTGLQTVLYNVGYRPARYIGLSKQVSFINTFLMSGLLHLMMLIPFGFSFTDFVLVMSFFLSQPAMIMAQHHLPEELSQKLTWPGLIGSGIVFLHAPILKRI